MARLGDVCNKITDGSHNPPAGIATSEYMMLSSKNIEDDNITYTDPRFLDKSEFETENRRTQISSGDLLMTIVGTVGRVAVVDCHTRNICLQRSVAVLKPKAETVDSRFLMYQIQSMRQLIENESHGVAQKGIYLSQVEQLPIVLPDLPTQRRIAATLDKVSEGIALCKQIMADLDELVKSQFVEMFGDLVHGDKIRGNKHTIGDIASVTKLAGFEFTKYITYQESGEIIMLRGLNCKRGKLILDDIKWIDKETSDLLPRSKLNKGDILMTYAGTIGDVALVDENDRYHLAPNVGKITLNDPSKYDPVFMIHLFIYTNDYIMTFASQSSQASISMGKIRKFEYHFPDYELQKQFALFVAQADKSKFAVQQQLAELEMLKKSLMQEYFSEGNL